MSSFKSPCGRYQSGLTRRESLCRLGSGFGGAALAALMAGNAAGREPTGLHHPARAKRVIWLFMGGGPSHVDTFDPKPALKEFDRREIPIAVPKHLRDASRKVLASPFNFRRHGESGIPVSELLPHMAALTDDLCVIRSMHCNSIDHTGATLQTFTGMVSLPRPGIGCWLLYGLGTENNNLPGYVVMGPDQQSGSATYSSRFLPAETQGTKVEWNPERLGNGAEALPNLRNSGSLTREEQRRQLRLLETLNRAYAVETPGHDVLDARAASFELAFRMQIAAPEAFDLTQESKEVHQLYGLDQKHTQSFGTRCLLARRLAERGVRFIQVQCGKGDGLDWDQHGDLEKGHRKNSAATDQPVAALIQDLKLRGLLDDTLVIWGGEFGRTPTSQGTNGREHHPHGYTICVAGGGTRGGLIHGATDDFGWFAEQDKIHIHDFHATVLHLMGIDHTQLTYPYSGRDFRLTDVHGEVCRSILS